MYILLNVDLFDINYIYYHETQKNNIIKYSDFIRLCYCDNNMNMNGIYLEFELNIHNIEYYENKIINYFSFNNNEIILNKLKNIETDILNYMDLTNLDKSFSLYEKFKNNMIITANINKKQNIKTIDTNTKFILKISGIWLSNKKFGLIYKIYSIYT
jgi:hypothetical protein